VKRACNSVASTVEATVTTAFATAKGTGPDSAISTPDDASPTPPPHTTKRTNAAEAEAEFAERGRAVPAGAVRSAMTVSMPRRLPAPADRALTAR
jgi:hypothetical protein